MHISHRTKGGPPALMNTGSSMQFSHKNHKQQHGSSPLTRMEEPVSFPNKFADHKSIGSALPEKQKNREEFDIEDDRTSSESSISCTSSPFHSERSSSSGCSTKSVRWSDIELHAHELVLGDHPSVESGLPLSIGWNTVFTDRLSIDEYESSRPERKRTNLFVPADIRHQRLIDAGYSRSELKDCLIELAAIQDSRRKNSKGNVWNQLKWKMSQMRPRKKEVVIRSFDG